MRSAIRWAADKVLTVLFGPEDECPAYPPTVTVRINGRDVGMEPLPCPCGCGMTVGEVVWLVKP